MSRTAHRVHFLDLPDELLLLICQNLQPFDLLFLSFVCKSLHSFTLPLYLSRFGVNGFLNEGLTSRPNIVLRGSLSSIAARKGLRVALFVTSIQSLTFRFSDIDVIDELDALRRLISKLSSVEIITLTNIKGWVYRDRRRFFRSLDALLDVVFAKGCINLTVYEWQSVYWWPTSSRVYRTLSAMTRALSTMHTRVNNFMCARDSTNGWGEIHRLKATHPSTALQALDFHSAVLFYPPILDRTIHTINSRLSTIIDLRIGPIKVTPGFWALFLRRITLPALCTLSILSDSLPFCELVKFVRRHRSIKTLNLSSCDKYDGDNPLSRPKKSPIILPGLAALTASPEYLRLLMDPCTFRLPKLRSISITSHQTTSLASIQGALSSLSSYAEPMSLTLNIPDHLWYPWMQCTSEDDDSYTLCCVTSLTCASKADDHTNIRTEPANTNNTAMAVNLELLAAFLARHFPALEHLKLLPPRLIDGGHLRQLISEVCPRIQMVEIERRADGRGACS